MSGGHFDYVQYHIDRIADEVDQLIRSNGKPDEDGWMYNYSPETIARFREGLMCLKRAAIYAQRIDWLVSGDDGEDDFEKRLEEELLEVTP